MTRWEASGSKGLPILQSRGPSVEAPRRPKPAVPLTSALPHPPPADRDATITTASSPQPPGRAALSSGAPLRRDSRAPSRVAGKRKRRPSHSPEPPKKKKKKGGKRDKPKQHWWTGLMNLQAKVDALGSDNEKIKQLEATVATQGETITQLKQLVGTLQATSSQILVEQQGHARLPENATARNS